MFMYYVAINFLIGQLFYVFNNKITSMTITCNDSEKNITMFITAISK